MEPYFGSSGRLSKVFPRYEDRPAQREMAAAVAKAIANDQTLLVEAGTGTGKTLAYLIPAALHTERVVISTGTKALQDQLISKDIPLLEKALGKKVEVTVLKGRSNYLCWYRFERMPIQFNLLDKREQRLHEMVREWSETTTTGDRAELNDLPGNFPSWQQMTSTSENCLGSKCPYYKDCFYIEAKEQAHLSHLVIVNHHLYFADTAVRESTGDQAGVLPEHGVVIFDEAHMLEDIATSHFGVEFTSLQVRDLVEDMRREIQVLKGEAQTLARFLTSFELQASALFALFQGEQGRFRLRPHHYPDLEVFRENVLNALRGVYKSLDDIAASEEVPKFKERCTLLAGALRFTTSLDDEDYVYMAEHSGRISSLQAFPINVATPFRRRVLGPRDAVIFTSATLTTDQSFNFFTHRLGIFEPETLQLASPFDFQRQTILYTPEHLPFPEDSRFPDAVVDEVEAILRVSEGRALVLCTSYRMVHHLREHLRDRVPYTLLVQGERPKGALVRAFQDDVSSVLIATATFWQGVDIPGEALSAVIIDKLPFASPGDPLVKARIDAINQGKGNAFAHYQVPMATLTLKQGVGRLIRHRDDSGLLAILDVRILKRPYGARFLKSLPEMRRVTSLKALEQAAGSVL